ncbi:hypothetical protein KW494_11935 [Vibrio fluvialis]|uniref:hypothetical protein n=1 Tax=Vibrio fluvialis TaxID=676 RepID=UPI001C9C3D32|nr:hypothetical protein [Vibrio fluvialis]MBY8112061.1 hypothetical protein [Vibrio fluvialis]MBY8295478.1 hypothetical protein [Vibrio fluvialis]MBY8311676.1 hypothetical protein [Vibrio fluvialis]MCE7643960.1 hypothetical protein [Vibrio fluvialis]
MRTNIFSNFMSTDNDLCTPLISQEKIAQILVETSAMLKFDVKPILMLDLEQLMVVDYSELPLLTDCQKEYIGKHLRKSPLEPDDLAFFSLRSLFGTCWNPPESNDDLNKSAAFEFSLVATILRHSDELAGELIYQDSSLPYWVRMSFLRILSRIPKETIDKHSLEKVACFPIKKTSFNANSAVLNDGAVIGFNYALEPILKLTNRYFFHYYSTQEYAGEKRLERAWSEILPIVLHFSKGLKAVYLTAFPLLFDEEIVKDVQGYTAEQVDFIMSHELGHIIHNHPAKFRDIRGQENERLIKHQYEYQADVFASEILRSRMVNDIRYLLNTNRLKEDNDPDKYLNAAKNSIYEYAIGVESTRLLFIYLDFIEQANDLLRDKLSGLVKIPESSGSHPSAIERYDNLEKSCLLDVSHETERVIYAKSFFRQVLEYANDVPTSKLQEMVANYLK